MKEFKMKLLLVCAIVLFVGEQVMADDLVEAPFRGLAGTTFSEWTYDDPCGVYLWDPPENSWFVSHPSIIIDPCLIDPCLPYFSVQQWGSNGDPCDPCAPDWADMLPAGRQGGIVFLEGSWDINNFIFDQASKDIWIQITYLNGTGEPSEVDHIGVGADNPFDPCAPAFWYGAERESSQVLPDGWIHEVFVVTMWPNPDSEWFEIAFGQPVLIDQIVIDTLFYMVGPALDFGDAPDDPCTPMYPTLLANNGARHRQTGSGGPWFGPADDAPDSDADGQPDADAMGDDNDAQGDDEDGITIPPLIQNTITNIIVEVANGPAYVHGWIDFNDDGDWNDAGELIINGAFLLNGSNPIPVTVPNNATVGETFARFRIVSGIVPSAPTGLWDDGEVEDHKVTVECSECGDLDDSGTVEINDVRILGINWQWEGTPGNNVADINCDGKVDNEDFAILTLLWQGSCP